MKSMPSMTSLPPSSASQMAHFFLAKTAERAEAAGSVDTGTDNGDTSSNINGLAKELSTEAPEAGTATASGAATAARLACDNGSDSGDGDAWAAASAILLGLAAELRNAAAGNRESAALAQALASAFAAMPAAEVNAMLVRRVQEGKNGGGERTGVRREPGPEGAESKSEVDDGRDGGAVEERRTPDMGGSVGTEAVPMTGMPSRPGEIEKGEGVANAVADACRDMVLTCLLGGRPRSGGGEGQG